MRVFDINSFEPAENEENTLVPQRPLVRPRLLERPRLVEIREEESLVVVEREPGRSGDDDEMFRPFE